MRRRAFIAGLSGAASASVFKSFASYAQTSAVPLIGVLSSGAAGMRRDQFDAFHSGLKETGYVAGQNLNVEYRGAEDQYDRLTELAEDFASMRVAVILAAGGPATALAVQKVTAVIPIVFTGVADPVRSGLVKSLLFQIDPAPYDAKVKQLKAAVADARQKVEQLKAQVDLAVADVKGLGSQLEYADKRREDVEKLSRTSATSQFTLQDAVAKVELLTAQLQAANAREINARLALGSEIDGENTTVAQLNAQLENAEWELEQTTIRAASDGYVGALALTVGARAVPLRAALSFMVADEVRIIGVFDQNGFKNIKRGAPVKMVFANRPGEVSYSEIADVLRGTGQGQVAVSGVLARAEAVGTGSTYPARIAVPRDLDRDMLRLGMVGTATVISEKAGPIGLLATILLWVKAYAAYL